jgi:hypothetical protein
MEHNDQAEEMLPQGEKHNQWLAMQSAYAQYRHASEALASSAQSADDLLVWRSLECQQRAAFEQYVETRLAFVESHVDETNQPHLAALDSPTRDLAVSAFGSRFGRRGLLFLALAIGLVGAVTLSVIRDHQRVRDLEASRDQLRAELREARDGIQRIANLTDAPRPSPLSALASPSAQAAPQNRALVPPPVSKARASAAVRRSYRFSLARSRQFTRVGPLEMQLKSVDAHQNQISLAVLSDSARLNLQHLKPNQTIRIGGAEHGQRMELVIDRISADSIYGHLIEYKG